MQKRVYLMSLIGLVMFVAISLIVLMTSGIVFPIQAESRVAIVFNDAISKNDFVQATEGAQTILNTMVNVADFAEVKNKVINSGFAVTDNVFNGNAKENANIWRKYVKINPIDNSFVLRITTGGRNHAEAEELGAVIAHEVSLEVPELFSNLRGISDQPREVSYQSQVVVICSLLIIVIIFCLFTVWIIFKKNKKAIMFSEKGLGENIVLPEKKPEGDPRYFLQKFLEEHQRH
jgi:hypothetical protein